MKVWSNTFVFSPYGFAFLASFFNPLYIVGMSVFFFAS